MGKHESHSTAALSMNPLISKARKPKFELTLKIYDLNNVPLVTGTSFVKWHLPSSTAAEHRGRTDRASIREHKVAWSYKRVISLRLVIDKNNCLQDCLINFEVVQDCSTAGRADKITLGKIDLNLAEYVDEGEFGSEDGETIVRRYLMQDSKINSTLKIGIGMKQIDGEKSFIAPPLKMAMVFGGITGIVAGEPEGKDDIGHISTTVRSRDQGEIQDVYRQILAASWASHDGELTADQCIEDIFNGGDGMAHKTIKVGEDYLPNDDSRTSRHSDLISPNSQNIGIPNQAIYSKPLRHNIFDETQPTSRKFQREHSKKNSETSEMICHTVDEVDEFCARDDLTAWKIWNGPET